VSLCSDFARDGFAIVPQVLPPDQVDSLRETLDQELGGATHARAGAAFANRDALSNPQLRAIACEPHIRALAEEVLGKSVFAVRGIVFDKVEGANWSVRWHQDLTIAVKERHEVPGYRGWSEKEGSPHVQAPVHILRQMVSVRLHIDPCGPDNGPLKGIPGTHLDRVDDALAVVAKVPEVVLTCKAGDAILMSPLLLHSSSAAEKPGHRRVLHIDYTCRDLDHPLEWLQRVTLPS
jgi:ectoine hydroxylase-related dioxygenase (phytanoyl-CoA dioxygenase family)